LSGMASALTIAMTTTQWNAKDFAGRIARSL
jgi:hypothetical protein